MPSVAPTEQTVVLLLLLASLVAVWIGRFQIPYTVGLVLAGILLDVLGLLPATTLTPDVFLWILLPPLLFEAAFALRWDHLARVAPTIGVLATGGVVVSGGVTAAVMAFLLHVPWGTAALFGVIVSATDPVAVVAFFRRAPVSPELKALVEGESLLNDGTVVVLVNVLAVAIAVGQVGPAVAVGNFLLIGVGGLVAGVLVGFLGSLVERSTSDYLVETTISVVVAFGSYLVAQDLGVSGVLAVVGAGSVLGNFGRQFGMSAQAREAIDRLWEFLAFVTNSFVFLLLGVAVVPRALADLLPAIGIGVVATLLGRGVVTYGLGFLLGRLTGIPSLPWRHVLFWGGLRGALPVVVAVSVADELRLSLPLADLVLGVVVVSLLLQGLTLEPVLRRVLALGAES
ncbi:MAG TPA: cation:proton antiporter [Chloroflexota bacterium]|nr:cation:proton antiporter [Chloroflexota bacterium]